VYDCQAGGRFVFRHNIVRDGDVEGHGLEAARERSCRAVEIYNNSFNGDNFGQSVAYFRGGVGLIHDNIASGYQQANNPFKLLHNRTNNCSVAPWGGADGTNPWDVNVPGGPFVAGATASIAGNTVSVSGVNWATNQWVGYTIKRTTNLGGVSGCGYSEIVGNTANTLTFATAIQGGTLRFTTGDSWQLWKVSAGMDQPGRSGGLDLRGVASPTLPGGWNNQATSPWYEWNNTREGGLNIGFDISSYFEIRRNEHYFTDTVAAGYTPYTYPHPLTQGGAPPPPPPPPVPPAAPSNLRIVTN